MTVSELIIAISVGVFVASVAESIVGFALSYATNARIRKRYEERIKELKDAVLKEAKSTTETGKVEEKI